jgi:predicted alpha/beta hydrolase family esterase
MGLLLDKTEKSSSFQRRAVIAHCWSGRPEVGWYPEAARSLAAEGLTVQVPALPEPDEPRLDEWLAALSGAIGEADDSLLLIGHSLGAVALLHWLARSEPVTRIGGLLLVAPPIAATGIVVVDRFLDPPPDLAVAGRRVQRREAIVSLADPYLLPDPLQLSRRLLSELGAQVRLVPDRGHFSPASCQTPLPELLDWVRACQINPPAPRS